MSGSVSTGRYVWTASPPAPDDAESFAREICVPVWLARMLIRRGIADAAGFQRHIHPRLANLQDPFALPGMASAVDRLLPAILEKQRITIFGDYDVDGITATALLFNVLNTTGAPVTTFLPLRLEEGYGLSVEALERCLETTRPDVIVTVDCGTGSVAAVRAAAAAGVDVIVTDHHSLGDELAPAVAVLNPRRSLDESHHVLAGVGVAFKLVHALLKKARQLETVPSWAQFDPKTLLDLVALGTVADLVPLIHENRVLVAHGLTLLNRAERPGLQALIEVAKIQKQIGTYEVGFLLGPRLNAAGRLGTAQASLQLLLTGDRAEASALARELDVANRERQAVEKAMVEEALTRVEEKFQRGQWYAIVEADESWHPGVVGIVASRIIQKHGRPTIVIGADDQGRAKGSGRSIAGFNLVEALDECREHLIKHGGHAMAAGLEVAWDRIPGFAAQFESVARRLLTGHRFAPQLTIDGWLELNSIDEAAVGVLESLGPFGMGNPEPVWACRGADWSRPPREVGTGHLKAALTQAGVEFDAIGFGLFQAELPGGPLDIAFQIRREEYRGRENVVLHLKDFRQSMGGDPWMEAMNKWPLDFK